MSEDAFPALAVDAGVVDSDPDLVNGALVKIFGWPILAAAATVRHVGIGRRRDGVAIR
jgi:hypothetical protein